MADELILTRSGTIAEIVFNRPEARNAATADMLFRMRDFVQSVEADAAIRCLVIRGTGSHFMAGGDVKAFVDSAALPPADRAALFEARVQAHAPLFLTLARMPQIVVAVLRGAVAGAGLSIAAFADIAIASNTAFFLSAQVRLGLSPDAGATFALPRHIGVARAKYLMLTGDRLSAEQAEAWGLIARVVEDSELDAAAATIVARIATGPAAAMARTKRLLAQPPTSLAQQFQSEAEAFAASAAGPDFPEGLAAFTEKREARF